MKLKVKDWRLSKHFWGGRNKAAKWSKLYHETTEADVTRAIDDVKQKIERGGFLYGVKL